MSPETKWLMPETGQMTIIMTIDIFKYADDMIKYQSVFHENVFL